MRKKLLFLAFAGFFLLFSGCSRIENHLEEKVREKIWEETKSLEDRDEQSSENAGEETETAEMDQELPKGGIHVTFAENPYLKIDYYLDAEHTKEIDTRNCYLDAGDVIFVSDPEISGAYSNKYVFSEFQLWEYDEETGARTKLSVTSQEYPLTIKIPEGYRGMQLAVEPLGRYEERTLILQDYYLDKDGKEVELDGVWKIGQRETTEEKVKIESITPYTFFYDYSQYKQKYYFAGSEPEDFYVDEKSGLVEFQETDIQSENESYRVKLCPYQDAVIWNNTSNFVSNLTKSKDGVYAIRVNGEDIKVEGTQEQKLESLRIGDKIWLHIGSGYKATAAGLEMKENKIELEDGYEYTFTVPEVSGTELKITVDKRTATLGGFEPKILENASVSVYDSSGKLLQEDDEVDDKEKVTVRISPAAGYYITGKNVRDDVYEDTMKYSKYVSGIDDIVKKHPVKKIYHATLDVSDEWGTCIYKLDGKEVSGKVELREEQKLELEYKLTDSDYQIVREKGIGNTFGKIFKKNKLTVSIEITQELDGSVIRRNDYIQLEQK